jgi:4-hydroxy-4-methyl-2-oxoglutarate aldolase
MDDRLYPILAQASTANVSDVLGSMGVMQPAIRTMVPGCKLLGRAFTVKAYPGSILTVHKALFEASAGDVLVVDGEGDSNAGALMGEIMALECQVKGFAGAVIDGAVRDAPGLVEQGLPVFARAATPRVGTNRRLGQTQVPVSCGGVVVRPGDLVMGDDNGVVVIPREREEGLVASLEALQVKEERLIQGIKDGVYLADTFGFAALFEESEPKT